MRKISGALIALLILSLSFNIPFQVLPISEALEENTVDKTFGNKYTPQPIILGVNDEPDYIAINQSDLSVRYYKDSFGYNTIYFNNSVAVQNVRWFMEYKQGQSWKQIGIPYNLTYEVLSGEYIRVVRHYTDYLASNYNLTFEIWGDMKIKIIVDGYMANSKNYRLRWELAGINKNYYSVDENRVIVYNEGEAGFSFDFSDVFWSLGDIASVDNSSWAGGQKLDIIFSIGTFQGFFDIDPYFGKTDIGGSPRNPDPERLRATKATLTESGTVTRISAYFTNPTTAGAIKFGIYSHNATHDRPLSLLATSSTLSHPILVGWQNVTINIFLLAGTYWLANWPNATWANGQLVYDAATNATSFGSIQTWNGFPTPYPHASYINENYSLFATYTPVPPTFYLTSLFHTGISSIDVNGTSTGNLTETAVNDTELALGVANAASGYSFLYWDNENVSHIHDITITKTMSQNTTITAYAIAVGGGGVSGVSMLVLAVVGGFGLIVVAVASRKR